ncbi:recombinase family protein [Acetatifactor aquisgranensis]|uniref:recombinase family protein n=1 Tax=Acetatifactor aquisgranensis TaxID=2941233 RepID=UPI00203FA513|nr:recombinase family protein [Acetatifactor aquisgranensis]
MLEDYAKNNRYTNTVHFTDDGFSGGSFERPGWKQMLSRIENGDIGTVIVKDLSRLGRDYLQTGYYTDMYFPSKRVRYIAISDGIDTSTGYNEMAPFKNLFNDFYARDISKKIRSTLTTKARASIYHSTVPPFGYRKSPADSHMLLRDEETASIIIKMYELSASGRGPAAIANYLRAEKIPIPAYWHHVLDSWNR